MGPQANSPTRSTKQDNASSAERTKHSQGVLPQVSALDATLLQRIQRLPTHLHAHDILQLQRAIGNHAVSTLLQRDAHHPGIGAQGGEVDGTTTQAIQRAKGGGTALPKHLATDMQSHIGTDVSHARIHTGQHADTLNRKLNAEAFTHGCDVFFSKDAYKPGSSSGKQLLAHELTHVAQQTGASSNRIQPQATDHAVVQRRLKFNASQLDGEVSTRAKRSGKFGFESTFSQIKRTLELYEAAGQDKQLQAKHLTKLSALIKKWFSRSKRKSNFKVNDGLKEFSLYKLQQEIDVELPRIKDKLASLDFMQTYSYGQPGTEGMMYSGVHDPLDVGKQLKHMEKHNLDMPDNLDDFRVPDGMGGEKGTMYPTSQWKSLGDQFKQQKPLGLTQANRTAMHMYTSDQFRWINPAMANSEDWFQGTMNEKLGMTDSRTTDKNWKKNAMAKNQDIGKMLNSSLDKLPAWKQTKTIYRGETIPTEEADSLQVGSIKNFAFFVSTSQSLSTPQSQLGSFLSPARPWGVIYHITSSKTGKDVAPWSNSPGEEEILFPPNTSFLVTKVITRDNTKKMLELEVKQM